MDRFVKDKTWRSAEIESITGLLARAVEQWPNRIFIDYEGKKCTYQEFDSGTVRIANGLSAAGVRRGDTVCVLFDTGPDSVLAWFAINKLGAVFVPLNPALRGDFLLNQMADADPRAVLTEADYVARIIESGFQTDGIKIFVRGICGALPASMNSFEELKESQIDPAVFVLAEHTDLALILYTSGTTGPSKGCMVSHLYACSIGRRLVEAFEITGQDIHWSPLPLFHIYGTCGIVLSALRVGACVALFRKFSVSNFWNDIETSQATVAHLVGSMIALIGGAPQTDAEKRCFGRLRVACGIPFSKASIDLWRNRFGVGWAGNAGYGLTEFGRVTAMSISGNAAPDTCGIPAGCEVRLFDEHDEECEQGESGEIVVRPLEPGLMFDGYWRRPDETVAAMRGLWFHTGDIGRFDAGGNLHFIDRKKDYMRRGGENISSYEVEEAFRKHPGVLDVAAYGVPSHLSEDEVKVSIILKPDVAITEAEMCRWIMTRLPYFCVPRYIEFHNDLPRGPTGKILKYVLKEQDGTSNAWDRSKSDIVLIR